MGIHKTKKLIKVSLYAAIIACAAGAATGTYAWYSYQKDVAVDMVGTTIKADKEIQVGLCYGGPVLQALKDEYSLGEIEVEENVRYHANDSDSFNIYWVRGNYLTDILRAFHEKINSAQGTLKAITAGRYSAGAAEDIGNDNAADNVWNGFKKTPSSKQSEWKHGGLVGDDKRDIFYLPLAFRALSNEKDENGDPVYLPNVEVFLSSFESSDLDAEANPNSAFDLSESLRCKVDYPSNNNTSKNFIFDPKAAADSYLDVAGPLNLNFDPYYDYNERTNLEVPYGEWLDAVSYESEPTGALDPSLALEIDRCTTFLANHKPGVKQIASSVRPAKCQTYSRDKAVNSQLTENAGKNIAKTDCLYNYGYVDLSIYLEGWDRNVVNSVAGNKDMSTDGHAFSVKLEFSIN